MYVKQQEYVEKEMTRRRESGLDTGFAAHMQVMKDVMARLKQEIEDERASLQKQHGRTGIGMVLCAGRDLCAEGDLCAEQRDLCAETFQRGLFVVF